MWTCGAAEVKGGAASVRVECVDKDGARRCRALGTDQRLEAAVE
jgi:hypothetical protein